LGCEDTYALLKCLYIFHAHTDSSRSSQMPCSLSGQVLNHDAGEDSELRFYIVQDAMVGEVESVGDLLARPVC
jgi:hypothetical protein